jgi:hypothetical protein
MVVVVMTVMVTPMMAVMPSLRFYYGHFPVLLRLVARRVGRRVVLSQQRRKVQGCHEQNQE